MQVGTCPNVLEYTSSPDSIPQRHAATSPGIKLSHHVCKGFYVGYGRKCVCEVVLDEGLNVMQKNADER
jgi:hypothetical protein